MLCRVHLNQVQTIQNIYRSMKISHSASDLKFKQIGKRSLSKPTRSISISDLQNLNQINYTKNCLYLHVENEDEGTQQYSKSRQKYSAIEDTRVSRFTHHKILIVEKNVLLLSLLIIFFGMMKLEADKIYSNGEMSKKIMTIMSCVTIILILLVVVRKVLKLQLEMDQQKFYIRKNNRSQCKSSLLLLLSCKNQVVPLLFQIMVIIPHPISFLQDVFYSYYSQNYQADLKYSVNNMLSVLMLFKVFLIFRSLVGLTIYSSPRMIRICRNNNFEYSFFYRIKCIQHQHPIFFIAFVFTITLFIFAFGFRVTQGSVYYLNPTAITRNGYESYFNCIWFAFISMTSLGYGDMTPRTFFARILASILTVFGLTLNSFLVVAFSQYLKMKSGEIRSHTTLSRLEEYNTLKSQSAQTLAEIIKMSHYMSRKNLDPMQMRNLKPMFNQLKRKIDTIKAETHKIRAILPEQNKKELMIHEFQVLKGNFKQIHEKQRKIKQKIVCIEQKKLQMSHARESFLNEVNNLLNRFK